MQSLLVTLPLASFSPLVTAQPLLALSRAAQTRSLDRHLLPVASAENSTASMSPTRKNSSRRLRERSCKSAFCPRGFRGFVSADYVAVSRGLDGHSLLHEAEKELAAVLRGSAVEAKDKLVEIVVQVLGAY